MKKKKGPTAKDVYEDILNLMASRQYDLQISIEGLTNVLVLAINQIDESERSSVTKQLIDVLGC